MTVYSSTELDDKLADNTAGDISAQDVRDLKDSSLGPYKVFITQTTLSSTSVANVDITGITQEYRDLLVKIRDLTTTDASGQDHIHIQLGNGSADTGSNYTWMSEFRGATDSAVDAQQDTSLPNGGAFPVALGTASTSPPDSAYAEFLIHDYAGGSHKMVEWRGTKTGASSYAGRGHGVWSSTSAADVVRVIVDGGNITDGTIQIYGLGVAE